MMQEMMLNWPVATLLYLELVDNLKYPLAHNHQLQLDDVSGGSVFFAVAKARILARRDKG